ncbi:ArsC/Spx/MgsR family protein [Pseudolabrys sp. FHR47]|uniref:ArsC/Spx/MgsR family protein n=1 Tax=Pseudolabrys sp. FHR47 TaxID=2562284 RepID=UPI0010BF36F7|nr:ArsC/Spx/MgsR family protein [Pseudolabrys sp. FHR47]
MATVVFYEKPGCKTNARQRQMLEAAGHTVVARNLLAEPWTAERLRAFFDSTPVASWFNRAAPRVKSGEINPEETDATTALTLMLREPLLIRRPLVEVDEKRCAGFDRQPVTSLLGDGEDEGGLESCTRQEVSCPEPRQPPMKTV